MFGFGVVVVVVVGGICLKPRSIFVVGDKQGCWCKRL